MEKSGSFILPWGRFGKLPEDIEVGLRPVEQGGNGLADKFMAYCERTTRDFR
jgi:retinol dehydrogenase 12